MEEENEEAIENTNHLRGKQSDTLFLSENEWQESSRQVISDNLVARNLGRRAINNALLLSNTISVNDGYDMVEELTLRANANVEVAGSSNSGGGGGGSREVLPVRQGHWKHLYQLAGGLGRSGSLPHRENLSKDKEQNTMHDEGTGVQRPLQSLVDTDGNSGSPNDGIRTKVLSSFGFPQFLVKNSLKGKGVVRSYPQRRDGIGVTVMGQGSEKVASVGKVVTDTSVDLGVKTNHPSLDSVDGVRPALFIDGIFLRKWLKPGRKVNRDENLYLFKQIVQVVDCAHSRQVTLHDVRPSCFKLLPSNQIKYVGSFAERELLESVMNTDFTSLADPITRKRFLKEGFPPDSSLKLKQQKLVKNMNFTRQNRKSSAGSNSTWEAANESDVSAGSQDSGSDISVQHNLNSGCRNQTKFGIPVVSNTTQNQFMAANFQLEDKWYTSPEEHSRKGSMCSSDIYCLGVILFELFCCFESWEVHTSVMLNLRHRILPPNFLSEYPKEAGFCLWLLHPEPSSRPTTREILHSELICESRGVSEGRLSLSVDEDPTESELLLHFLISLKEHKHKHASKLVEDIDNIEADIEEVEKRHLFRITGGISSKYKDPSQAREFLLEETVPFHARLIGNIGQLESAYFSMRSNIQLQDTDGMGRSDKELLKNRESGSQGQIENEGNQNSSDHLGVFFDGLCKYARYSKFKLCGTLRNGDLLNSANVICSLSFNRDQEYFATAGVSKKIKIFEFDRLMNDSVDIHYPVVEMTSKSKLSCVCWNNYIKNYLAATDYDGVVQLWDASTGQGFSQYTDHEKRAWSVDFSPVDPTKLSSGSDDCSVKLWSINEKKCISTIRSSANVCCVQFSADSTHLLAFGSADYKTYCYDLRNTRNPWCTLAGHGKAVSFVKFLDSETLISASTDNTLKLWDLNKTSSNGLSDNACSLTFRGHTNEKNFVGLSISDGYIACGSESNEVYAYYKSLPMPITGHKFGSIDPISGQENGDDSGQFVSSVCWRGNSDMVIAANSTGSIKLFQMT